ncbi:hypothetical protein [Psychroflexus sediminis]|uniref:Uncharacterized protein n=1 Tax=Psychroflexus sediminis TaxID=470826 RepID=A0A1G7Y2P9_9FLAO|nr:hypothetical protein [Psychroflexus sediminis]SDG90230.1 hypothetical protein SAMN04488027_11074 [Psychroflexus sediminis]
MKYYLASLIFILISPLSILAQNNTTIETVALIEILSDNVIAVNKDTIPLNLAHKKITRLLENHISDGDFFPSITLVAGPSISENSIENIKYQIRSTAVQLINLQRKTIINFDGIEINQDVLDQYNSLINYWNTLRPENRFYRENDLKFIESVALNMSFNQCIRNEKLPGYLPFVKEEPQQTSLSALIIQPDLSYLFVHKEDTIKKEEAFKHYLNQPYILKRRIIDEEKMILVEIIQN